MTRSSPARRFARLAVRPTPPARRLTVEALEAREVPAHNLTVVAGTVDSNIQVFNPGNGPTATIFTDGNDAQLSIGTLEAQLRKPGVRNVIVTTDVKNGQPGTQAGTITWDEAAAGSLDFTGFGSGKTLTFQTVTGTNATGDITVSGVDFANGGSGDQIGLVFDSSGLNGDITFQNAVGTGTVKVTDTAVLDLTVNAGTGAFSFTDGGITTPGDVGGAIRITAGPVTLAHTSGLTAVGPVTITVGGAVTLAAGTGLYSSTGDVTVAAGGAVTGTDVGLTALAGKVTVSGTDVTLTENLGPMIFTAEKGLAVSGTGSLTVAFGTYDVSGDVSFTSGGPVSLSGVGVPNDPSLQDVGSVTVSGTAVGLNDTSLEANGTLAITGTAITVGGPITGAILGSGRAMTLTGPVTLASGGLSLYAAGPLTVTGAVEGPAPLFVAAAGAVTFGGTVGATAPLSSFTLNQGSATIQGGVLKATDVTVGTVSSGVEATLGLAGPVETLVGNVVVRPTGNLAPGGVGHAGTLLVTGNVTFDGGDFTVDFEAGAADQLIASGTVTIDNTNRGTQLGAGLGTGQLGGTPTLISAGTLTGKFANTEQGGVPVPVLVGTDVATALYTPTQLIVAPYTPGGPATTATGVDFDGTLYKITLAGGGQVVTGRDWLDQRFVVARNTTPASRLTVTTTANGSDDVVTFEAGVLVSGPLAAYSGPKANIGTQFRASGAVAAATLRDFESFPGATGVTFGGTLAQHTAITARNLFGNVSTGSTLSLLKVAGALGAGVGVPLLADSVVSAPAIGTVVAGLASTHFTTPRALTALTVAGDYFGNVSAGSVGTLTAGSMTGDVTATRVVGPGNVVLSTGAVGTVRSKRAFHGAVTAAGLGRFESDGGGSADLTVAGRIGSVIGKGESDLTLEMAADSVGLMQVVGGLGGDGVADGTDWTVTNGIGSLRAGSLGEMDVSAKFLGPVTVTGNTTFGLSGDVRFATFTLTGNDGTLGQYGLRSLSVQGTVSGTTFDVRGGNVGPVKVGRFQGSRLYLNYTPNGAFNTGGSFGAKGYRLASFTTTALPAPGALPPYEWAFQDSEVAADSIGTVTLSGVRTDDAGTAFGIKVHKTGAVLVVKAADAHTQFALNTSLSPKPTAIEDDFYFIRV
jgi:hypothetical protein